MDWKDTLSKKLTALTNVSDFNYIETNDIRRAGEVGLCNSGIYMEATVVYFEIKNIPFMLKEHGRRKVAQAYTMYREVLGAIAEPHGAFVNAFSANAFVIIYPGKEDTFKTACRGAMKIASAITETFKSQFNLMSGLEFSMGIDHGHIMGVKNLSDNDIGRITWFGTCIYKAIRIARECARPFYVGISGNIYHSLDEDLRVQTRRILGIKKRIEIWNKVTYQFENVKKHLYQTNYKMSIEEEDLDKA